ncbi:Protein Wnt-6 [Eufriesea mexicana]|nr:Protein Wnt-6 [Eufriesea mexicana]
MVRGTFQQSYVGWAGNGVAENKEHPRMRNGSPRDRGKAKEAMGHHARLLWRDPGSLPPPKLSDLTLPADAELSCHAYVCVENPESGEGWSNGADSRTRNSSRIRRNVDDRERRNKLAKRQEAEKQPDPARLGVSLSWDRCRVIGPNRGFRVHYSVTRSRLTVCDAALRDSRQKPLAGPPMLPSFFLRILPSRLSLESDWRIPSCLDFGSLRRFGFLRQRSNEPFDSRWNAIARGERTDPRRARLYRGEFVTRVAYRRDPFFRRFVLVIIEESVGGCALWSASIVSSGTGGRHRHAAAARPWFEQVLRNSRLMRRPGVQVKRIMAFNEEESCGSRGTELAPNCWRRTGSKGVSVCLEADPPSVDPEAAGCEAQRSRVVRRRVKRGKEGLGCVSLPPSGAHLPSPQQSRTVRSDQELRLRSRTNDSLLLSPTIGHFPPPHDRATPRQESGGATPSRGTGHSPTHARSRSRNQRLPVPNGTTEGSEGEQSAIVEVTSRGGGDGDAPRSRGDLPPSRYPHRRLFLDRWKSGGDGSDAHLQKDQETEGQDGGHLSQGALAAQGNRERRSDTRETGFVNAITAAGVTYAVTRACTMGHLVECSCDKMTSKGHRLGKLTRTVESAKSLPTEGDWEWGGCGDNVKFGFKKSRDFMDAPYRKRSDIKTLVKLHNNNAGRLAIRDFMSTECKCHGLSGSCTVRTCWRKMPPFRDVGNRLKESFDGAAKVIPSNDGHSFITEGPTIKPPDRFDLIYSEDSPDFCKPNRKTGSLGTQGRRCNSTSQGVDGCELLCCGRGYDTRVVKEKISCECRFRWCCEVTCNTCLDKKTINTCR